MHDTNHPHWPGCLQRNLRLQELAPAHAASDPCYLFQRSANQYIVVDIIQGMSYGPLPWDEGRATLPAATSPCPSP